MDIVGTLITVEKMLDLATKIITAVVNAIRLYLQTQQPA